MNLRIFFALLTIPFLPACAQNGKPAAAKKGAESVAVAPFDSIDLSSFYRVYQVDGMFAIINGDGGQLRLFNEPLYRQPSSPASTFNILLTLIGTEEGILKDSATELSRGDIRITSSYPRDTMPLSEGFRNNRDWFFIRLAKMIGADRISYWLKKCSYGNQSVEGEADRFWVKGALKITPEQQLDFIKKFHQEQLPFSKKSFSVVKSMMFQKEIAGLRISGRRGSNKEGDEKFNGWYIGWIETQSSIYYFVNYIESPDMQHPHLIEAQKEVLYDFLPSLQLK